MSENNITPTSSSSTAQVEAEIQSKTSQPLDGASCSASLIPKGEYSIMDYRSMPWFANEMKDLGCEDEAQKAWTKTLHEITPKHLLPLILKSLAPLPSSPVLE